MITLRRVVPLVVGPLLVLGTAVPASAAGAPGSVISATPLPGKEAPGSTATTITYWTENSLDQPRRALATIYVPTGTAPAGGWPILANAHVTAGLGDACAYTDDYGTAAADVNVVTPWIQAGFAFVATEYIGIGTEGSHAYLDATAEANAVIDSVRAARAVAPTLSSSYVVNGISQGGHATLATAAAAKERAPELRLAAAMADAPATKVEGYIPLAGPYIPPLPAPDYTTYVSYILAGLETARPDFDLDAYLTPAGRAVVDDAHELCYFDMNTRTQGVSIGQMLTKPLNTGPFPAVLREVTTLPVSGYDAPVLVNQGRFDVVAFPFLTDLQVTEMLVHGAKVTYRQYATGHNVWAQALPNNIAFARKHLAG
ncbi:lipase family protein [Actinoplanes derwentensis]|uniref:Secretory lipase n=1 Tax=Actinoplanes derwentensis TaxID=113562 RepID=A0A1H2B8L0_9ACTN|nr:lipase family protein [Actinoplanes derwentensis]GID86457.1 lipase [Actinoplanes derwentensis]SDT54561.1 Secretory lipase [Actinoplanes derwentensis]